MMRKLIILAFTVLTGVYARAQEVKVTHNLPATATAGETIDAQFTVSKGNIGAFAKFQCDVPPGTQATAGDTKSGNFTFENNRVKIVWVSLPGEPSFTFSVKLTISSSASGPQNFTSQFFYLENNVKKEYAIPVHSISVGGVASNNNSTANTSTTTATTSTTSTSENNTTSASTPTTSTSENTNTTATNTTTTAEGNNTGNTSTGGNTTGNEANNSTIQNNSGNTQTTSTPTTTTNAGGNTSKGNTASGARPGLVYYVQVAALSTDPGLSYKKYGKMKVVVEGGLYKVLIGNYSSMEEARSHKADLISKGLVGSFIVAYENGVRVKL